MPYGHTVIQSMYAPPPVQPVNSYVATYPTINQLAVPVAPVNTYAFTPVAYPTQNYTIPNCNY